MTKKKKTKSVKNKPVIMMNLFVSDILKRADSEADFITEDLINVIKESDEPQWHYNKINSFKNINDYDDRGETLLIYYRHEPEIFSALIRAGADVNKPSKLECKPAYYEFEHWTPLMYAVSDWDNPCMLNIIAILLENKADVNLASEYGVTPLMISATIPMNAPMKMLLNAGANVLAEDKNKKTVFHYLFDSMYEYDDGKFLDKYTSKADFGGALNLLLQHSPRILSFMDEKNWTNYVNGLYHIPELYAAELSHIIRSHMKKYMQAKWKECAKNTEKEINKYLIKNKSIPNKLFIKAVSNYPDTNFARKIIPLQKNINARDEQGMTALHHCAQSSGKRVLETLKLLVKHGANINAKDEKGNRPVDYIFPEAWETKYLDDVIKLLTPISNKKSKDLIWQYFKLAKKRGDKNFSKTKDDKICQEMKKIKKRFTEKDWDKLIHSVPVFMRPMVSEQKKKQVGKK